MYVDLILSLCLSLSLNGHFQPSPTTKFRSYIRDDSQASLALTSNYHHYYGEHFLIVGFWRNITETNGRHAGHSEVERRYVHGPFVGTSHEISRKRHVFGDRLEGSLHFDKRDTRRARIYIELDVCPLVS